MPQIRIGSLVHAHGERLLRKVLAIKDDHARCEAVKDGSVRWFSLARLSVDTPPSMLKTFLL